MAITGFVFATSATTSMNALPSLICSMYMMMAFGLGVFFHVAEVIEEVEVALVAYRDDVREPDVLRKAPVHDRVDDGAALRDERDVARFWTGGRTLCIDAAGRDDDAEAVRADEPGFVAFCNLDDPVLEGFTFRSHLLETCSNDDNHRHMLCPALLDDSGTWIAGTVMTAMSTGAGIAEMLGYALSPWISERLLLTG